MQIHYCACVSRNCKLQVRKFYNLSIPIIFPFYLFFTDKPCKPLALAVPIELLNWILKNWGATLQGVSRGIRTPSLENFLPLPNPPSPIGKEGLKIFLVRGYEPEPSWRPPWKGGAKLLYQKAGTGRKRPE